MSKRWVVSLFDESGVALEPWANAGFRCVAFDLLNPIQGEVDERGIVKIALDLSVEANLQAIMDEYNPVFVSCFAPCTDLAGSGARHYAAKLAADPECQAKAIHMLRSAERMTGPDGCAWYAENPVGKAATLWRKPDFYFNPCDYGGYLPEEDVHPEYPEYLQPRDAYTKKTGIWHGNGFIKPEFKRVEPFYETDAKGHRSSPLWKKLGGKSERTKRIRSKTPRGWAKAVFLANHERIASCI